MWPLKIAAYTYINMHIPMSLYYKHTFAVCKRRLSQGGYSGCMQQDGDET